MSRYEQIIDELEVFLDNCKRQKLSNINIVVNKEKIDEYINELKIKTPEEIRKYQRIINNRDAILNSAQENANQILEQARMETEELISEHEITQQACQQADEMLNDASAQAQQMIDDAVREADAIRAGAIDYTDQMLSDLQRVISHTMDSVAIKYDNLMKQLNTSLEVVIANRKELRPVEQQAVAVEQKNTEENMTEVPVSDAATDMRASGSILDNIDALETIGALDEKREESLDDYTVDLT